jgi:hypothetical protein
VGNPIAQLDSQSKQATPKRKNRKILQKMHFKNKRTGFFGVGTSDLSNDTKDIP